MRGRLFSFIGWIAFFRTVTWFDRVKCARAIGVALTMTYCEEKRFIPGFPNSPARRNLPVEFCPAKRSGTTSNTSQEPGPPPNGPGFGITHAALRQI
jgi:hypothetical protein